MNDKDPPIWIPLKLTDLTQLQKEEAKKNPSLNVEYKMKRGYLVCKSAYESLEEVSKDSSSSD